MKGATKVKDQTFVGEWAMVMKLIETAFKGEDIPAAFVTGILVLLPKPDGDYRGIALLEVIYKLISSIINRRLVKALSQKLHDGIHGFRTSRGTGTAIMETKLLMQLAQRSNKPLHMIFLDLKKAYDTLDRDRTMKILEGYGIGENVRWIIQMIWQGDTMVPKQAGFFGRPFRATRGVRQGDIVSPFIFNIVCDAIIREWEMQMNNIDTRQERKESKAQFYADDGLLTGDDAQMVQNALNIFTDTFARVGLKMNAVKTKAMTMAGCKAYTKQSTEAYNRKLTGEGSSHRQRALTKVECNLCGATVNQQSMKSHQLTKKCTKGRKDWAIQRAEMETPEQLTLDMEIEALQPMEYRFNMPPRHDTPCPVPACPYITNTRPEMRRHFRARHPEDTIIINEEGLLPQCEKCGIFQKDVGIRHQASKDCKKASKTQEARNDEKRQALAKQVTFMVGDTPIENVKQFKYLGRILEENDDDWLAVQGNVCRARQKWGRIGRILSKEKAKPRIMAIFYKAVVQSVLLYGSESWVLTKKMLQVLRSFHHRCARYITHRHIRQDTETGEWSYPNTETTLEEAGLWTIEEYIERRRNTVMNYVKERAIYRRCKNSHPVALSSRKATWWEQ